MEQVKILLVEDDPGHARLIKKNMLRAGISNEFITVNNGQAALDFLHTNSCGQGTPECLLVLLDLNLPVLDGYQVLERIKNDERTKKIPVVVLTTTDVPQEITRCYELGCNIFVTKPVQYDEFCNVVRNLGLLMSIVKIP